MSEVGFDDYRRTAWLRRCGSRASSAACRRHPDGLLHRRHAGGDLAWPGQQALCGGSDAGGALTLDDADRLEPGEIGVSSTRMPGRADDMMARKGLPSTVLAAMAASSACCAPTG